VSESKVAIENLKLTKDNMRHASPDKNPTLIITLPNGIELIKFKCSQEEYESLYSETGCTTINLVGACAENAWYGNITP